MERKYEQEAKTLCEAIKNFANDPEALNNLESYLSLHFETWIEKWANTPEGLANELKHFSTIYTEE